MKRIKINDLPITCFDYDTDQSLSDRFASMMQTIPQWIDPISIKTFKNGDEMKVNVFKNDVIEAIKTYDKDFKKFINSISDRPYYQNITFDTILKYWLYKLHQTKPTISNEYGLIGLELSLEDYKNEIGKNSIFDFLKKFFKEEQQDFIKSIEKREKTVKNRSKKLTDKFSEIGSMPIIPYKNFVQEKVVVKIKLPITRMDMSLQTVFANLECYRETPFFAFDGIYKFYNDLKTPLTDWERTINTAIIGYIYTSDNLYVYQHNASSYSQCFITFEDDDILTVYIEIEYPSSYNQKSYKDAILSRFFKCFEHNYKIYDNISKIVIEEEQIVGIAIFPLMRFNTIVMSDMIMNNDVFSHFLVVDESEQASKEKSGLYTHFFIESDEGKASIMTRIASKELQEIKHIDRESLPYGSPYVRIRITQSKNMSIVDQFLSIFSQLIGLYNKYEDRVISDYLQYGVSIDKKQDYDIQTTFSLSELEPELFHSKYTRSCGSHRQPFVIREDETKNYEPHQYITFPKTPEEGTQRIYVCDPEKNKNPKSDKQVYAGLIVNKGESKDKYHYIPCCFSDNQLDKNSHLKEYLTMDQKNVKIQQNVITTDKFANNKFLADLPDSLSELFTMLESSKYVKKQYNYLRLGVSETRLSFLDCVLKATFTTPYDLETEYQKLLNYPFLSVASQENPDESDIELYNKLKNTNYLDPRRWIRLLEEVYQCKIVVFSRDREKNDPMLLIPFHKVNHLSYQSAYKTIIAVYEHYGGEATQLEDFPRCELIVSQLKENHAIVYNYFLHARTKLVDFQHNTYKQSYYHIPTHQLKPIVIDYTYNDVLDTFNIDNGDVKNNYEQFIDTYGKTRAIIVNGIYFFTSPIPPLVVKSHYSPNFKSYFYADVKKYIEKHKIISTIQNNDQVEITFENVKIHLSFTVKIVPSSISMPSVYHQPLQYPSNQSNEITSFFDKKRLVVFLTEYFMYFYSFYCNKHQIRENMIKNTEVLQKFVREHIIIKENNLYQLPTVPTISLKQLVQYNFVEYDGDEKYGDDNDLKFIVDSKETKRRLVYALHVSLSTHFTQIYTYYMQSEIYNFYTDATHYNNYPSQNTVTNHIDIFDEIDRQVYNSVQPSLTKYFFENKLVSHRPVLLVKASDKEDASLISYEWETTHRIDEQKYEEDIKKDTDIYLYQSKTQIKPYKTYDSGNANSHVLAYKTDGVVNYMAIANL
jgi:hypothetical protein